MEFEHDVMVKTVSIGFFRKSLTLIQAFFHTSTSISVTAEIGAAPCRHTLFLL
jgi:hypothetical protein